VAQGVGSGFKHQPVPQKKKKKKPQWDKPRRMGENVWSFLMVNSRT
jgi:hypothetical protein